MNYLDSSAVLKLLFDEPESGALADWVHAEHGAGLVSSELAKLEVIRASWRLRPESVSAARTLMSQLDLVPLTSGLIEEATMIADPLLRSLDAIHLASALSVRTELTALVAYDHRLLAAAASAGLPTLHPGA